VIHKGFVSSSAFFELVVRYIKSVVVIGRVCRIVMENIHDILSSFHSRLQVLEKHLGVRAIPERDEDQERFENSKHSLEEIIPYILRNSKKTWRIQPDVKSNYSGRMVN